MKKIKCIKCGLYFKDRGKDNSTSGFVRELCWNCGYIWHTLGMIISAFEDNPLMPKQLNRKIAISLDGIEIRRKKLIK